MKEQLLAIVLGLTAAVCIANGQQTAAPTEELMYQPPALKPIPAGAVLVSRNYNERDNRSPGYWNHLCVYAGDGTIIEAQPGVGVQAVPWATYRARPQSVLVVFPRTPELGQAAALRAKSLVGTPYWRLSSVTIFPRPVERGMNCVSVVDYAYATRLRRPDNVFWNPGCFASVPPQ